MPISTKDTAATVCVVVEGQSSASKAQTTAELLAKSQTSPLFSMLASASGLESCQIRYQPETLIVLEYRFGNGDWLQIKRDDSLEYSEQRAVASTAANNNQLNAMLANAEQVAFGTSGCGIDWRAPDVVANDDGSIESIFRGDLCNCQARIRRHVDKPEVELVFKSTC